MDSMGRHCPAIAKILDLNNLPESYAKLPRISIDYALMEKARNVAVIKSGMDWCDMGNWDMFCEKLSPGRGGNRFVGPVRASGTSGSMIANYTTAPVVIAGLSGVVVVQTSQGTLVTARGRAEEAALFAKSVKR
jgi:mannose-1-phosphate guanylyltransferase